MFPVAILKPWRYYQKDMDENKNNQPIDDERKQSIRYTFGCLLIIFIGITSIVIGLIFMYLKSITTGSKEFFLN
jgi:hypothetical protein